MVHASVVDAGVFTATFGAVLVFSFPAERSGMPRSFSSSSIRLCPVPASYGRADTEEARKARKVRQRALGGGGGALNGNCAAEDEGRDLVTSVPEAPCRGLSYLRLHCWLLSPHDGRGLVGPPVGHTKTKRVSSLAIFPWKSWKSFLFGGETRGVRLKRSQKRPSWASTGAAREVADLASDPRRTCAEAGTEGPAPAGVRFLQI